MNQSQEVPVIILHEGGRLWLEATYCRFVVYGHGFIRITECCITKGSVWRMGMRCIVVNECD